MNTADYDKCARRIVDALQVSPGERILIKRDRRTFGSLFPPLKNLIQASGAEIIAEIFAEETKDDLELFRWLFEKADVYIWLPEVHQGSPGAQGIALREWLDARRGRAVHFHWQSGSYPIGFHELPSQDFIDRIYMAA